MCTCLATVPRAAFSAFSGTRSGDGSHSPAWYRESTATVTPRMIGAETVCAKQSLNARTPGPDDLLKVTRLGALCFALMCIKRHTYVHTPKWS